jgi:short-subunit dehydrogenase
LSRLAPNAEGPERLFARILSPRGGSRRVNVFLTGASSGIGAALARCYADRGAQLGLFARRQDALAAIAASLAPASPELYSGDVRDEAALRRAAADFTARYGPADVVVANAGISRGTQTDYVEDNPVFRATFETNVLGMLHTFQPFLPSMRSAGKGKLVGIASVAGFRGLPGAGAYSASKAAAINYLESLRVELAGSGVQVITICPGYVATPMTAANPYPMPFLLSAPRAATLIVRAIAGGRRFYVLPWQMRWGGRVFSILPRALFDRLMRRAVRKPRGGM